MKNRPRILLIEDDRAITSGMEKVMDAEGSTSPCWRAGTRASIAPWPSALIW